MQRRSLDDRWQNNWKVFSDINKNSLRITSYENGETERLSSSIDKLPLDVEIFQNLVDNICRKFNPGKGENLLCFGGCAVFSDEGVLQRIENFLPQSPALLSSWLKMSPWLHAALIPSATEKRTVSEVEVRKALWEALLEDKDYADALEEVRMDRATAGRTDSESVFRVSIPEKRRKSGDEEVEVEDPTNAKPEYSKQEEEAKEEVRPRGRKKCKYKLKNSLPLPPRPVLSLSQDEIQHWFPFFVERLGGKRFPTSKPAKIDAWDADVDAVLTAKDFMDYGPRVALDWTSVSSTFSWKLKLAAAIILDKRGLDYTTFAEEVEEKHEKYSINDLKLMSMSKNPETFEKLFVKNGLKGKKKPNYLDEFERKSSEIVLQNLRLINARDKRINGNSLPRQTTKRLLEQKKESALKEASSKEAPPPPPLYHQRIPSQVEVARAVGTGSPTSGRPPPLTPSPRTSSFSSSSPHTDMSNHSIPPLVDTMEKMVKLEADALEHPEDLVVEATRAGNPRLHQMPALKPIDEDFVFNSTPEDLSLSPKQKRKKSMESKEAKPLSQKYMCKNNFQKGDFLIHPLHLHTPHGPVKLVTFRRETKKVFLSVSEFETASVSSNGAFEEVVLERDAHKPRSTPAKFLDSFIRINDSVEVLDRRSDKMRIKRRIPKNVVISEPVIEHSNLSSSDGMKLEINDADEDTEDSKESIEDDSEMVIDET